MIFNELGSLEDHYSIENYIQMPIAAIFGLLKKIRPTIEREYIYIYIYILLRICIYSLFSCENWKSLLYAINSGFIYIFMLTSKISNAFIPYKVYFSSL